MTWIKNSGGHQIRRVPAVSVSSDADWIARSTATGVWLANRLETQAKLTQWMVNDSTSDHVTLDTTTKINGFALGSFKFNVLNTDSAASGSVCIPFPSAKGVGSVFWISYAVRADDAACYQEWCANYETGPKLSILSRDANGAAPIGSNQPNEIVEQINYNAGAFSGYHQDGHASAFPPDMGTSTNCSGSDFRWQPKIDHGANPLTGNDPETGAAWSSCAQDRARYGGLYSAKSLGGFEKGVGDPLTGALRQLSNQYYTVTKRIEVNSMDGATFNNRLTTWVAPYLQPYILLSDEQSMELGPGPDYNGHTLLPYTSHRSPGGRHSTLSGINGVSIVATGGGTAIGAGTLKYVVTGGVGLFSFSAVNDSFGTSRGISAANGIFFANLKSSLHGVATTSNGSVTFPVSSIVLVDASGFPAGGGSCVFGSPDTSNPAASHGNGEQYIQFTGKSGNTLTGVTGGVGTHDSGVPCSISSFIAIRVDNPALLPGSGTTNATVTVSIGRNNGQVNYNDFIGSDLPINAPGGYPPTGLSALADVSAVMTSGTWVNFGAGGTVGGVTWSAMTGLDLLQSGPGPSGYPNGASGIRTPYCSEAGYDGIFGKIMFHTGDHDQPSHLFRYNEDSHTLVIDHGPAWMDNGPSSAVHGYDHFVIDKNNVKWSRKIDEEWLRQWAGYGTGDSWTNSTTIAGPGGSISAAGHCYHAALNKILVHQLGSNPNGILVGMDPDTQVWTTYSTTLLNPGDPHNFNCYNTISKIAWFGGGNGTLNSWQIDASATITAAAANLPDATGPSNAGGLALPNPHNGDFTVWYDGSTWYDYKATTTRTFVAKAGTSDAFTSNMPGVGIASKMGGVIGVSIPRYGVFVFFKAWARLVNGEMWIYKP